jgi:hypothetical protein
LLEPVVVFRANAVKFIGKAKHATGSGGGGQDRFQMNVFLTQYVCTVPGFVINAIYHFSNTVAYTNLVFGSSLYDAFSVTRLHRVDEQANDDDDDDDEYTKRNSNPRSQRPSDSGQRLRPRTQ